MEGIIVGVDESPFAEAALRWAARYAALTPEPITAVMAWGYIDQRHLEPSDSFDPAYTTEMADKVLDDLVRRALGEAPEVRRHAVCDLPAPALLDAAKDASMVVVGLDGSAPSLRALRWAARAARLTERPLVALHAWRPPATISAFPGPWRDPATLAAGADHFLRQQVGTLDPAALPPEVEYRTVPDRPAAALIEASCLASLVVVGSRGNGPLTGALIGSVSDQVSHHATSPVVVVP